jgi:hypothetical protein
VHKLFSLALSLLLLLSLPSALYVNLIVVEHSLLVSACLFASGVPLQQGFVKKDVTVGLERGLVYLVICLDEARL